MALDDAEDNAKELAGLLFKGHLSASLACGYPHICLYTAVCDIIVNLMASLVIWEVGLWDASG